MAESVYFAGADADISVGATPLAGVKGWSFEIQWDHNDLYSQDSIFILGSAKFKQRVPIKMKYVKFDPAAGSWWLMQVLTPGTGGGGIADSSKVQEFTITGVVVPFIAGGVKMQAAISGCYFENIPLALDENEWLTLDLSAIGSDVVFSNPS